MTQMVLNTNHYAGAAIAAFKIVKWSDADSKVVAAAAATDKLIGVNESLDVAEGERIDVCRIGIAAVLYGGTVTRGDKLTADSQGRAVRSTNNGDQVIGTAEVSGVVGDIGSVLIVPATMGGRQFILQVDIADLSAEAAYHVVSPFAGTVAKIWSVTDGAVSTADVTITPSIGGVDITDGVVTIATAASAAGDVDSATPSAANTVTAGQAIKLTVTGGGSGGSPRGHVYIVIDRT